MEDTAGIVDKYLLVNDYYACIPMLSILFNLEVSERTGKLN